MVNYCCVQSCGRNSKSSSHLNFYSLPKERHRQRQWLIAAGREDLLEKAQYKMTYRFCSRHFAPSSIRNRTLTPDAVPTLCLPGSNRNGDSDDEPVQHQDIACNNCTNAIRGYRYKCVTCIDYDLCPKCEMMETHSQHYMLRIPRPLKFKIADDMIKRWQNFFKSEHVKPNCSDDSGDSSDDEPITKYVTQCDSGVDLSDDVKETLRKEVARVLTLSDETKSDKSKKSSKEFKAKSSAGKRSGSEIGSSSKKQKTNVSVIEKVESLSISESTPALAFADVNEAAEHGDEVKFEVPALSSGMDEFVQPMMHVKLSDDLTELMIEMTQNGQKTVYKYAD